MAGVRMGEMVVSANPTDELTALGLGSCIGLAIVDRRAGVAGLAHIVLPESHVGGELAKFADTAVPLLVERMRRAGAAVPRMEAAIAGGARMFEMSGGLDVGSRNDQAVRTALSKAKVALRASETGGNQGRTVRINVGEGLVTVRVAGQPAVALVGGKRPPRTATSKAAASPTGAERARKCRGPRAIVSTTGAQP
jgi:chemotaxis protein CheD